MNLYYLGVVLGMAILTIGSIQAQNNDCSPPWERITDDMCILLNSGIKVWSHASLLCKFHQGSLLYVQNEEEQSKLTKYVQPLIPFRFGLRPYIWLEKLTNSTDSSDGASWKWSNIDKQANYTNWLRKQDDPSEFQKECACFRVRDGAWRPCDCSSIQHFICRKTEQPMGQLSSGSSEKVASNIQSSQQQQQASADASSSFINIVRMKIRKNSYQFRRVECPLGFGYYPVPDDTQCSRYKLCQNWDNIYGFMLINKCLDGMAFDFETKRCVPATDSTCQINADSFYPL